MKNKKSVEERDKAYNKKYQLENKEKIKKMQSDYYARNKLARIENSRKWVSLNKEKAKETRRLYRESKIGRFKSIKNSAKSRNIEFNLTEEDVYNIIEKDCLYCGQKKSNGIDRINSNGGYTNENSIPCCSMCNYMKKDFTQEDFINQCKKISSHLIIL